MYEMLSQSGASMEDIIARIRSETAIVSLGTLDNAADPGTIRVAHRSVADKPRPSSDARLVMYQALKTMDYQTLLDTANSLTGQRPAGDVKEKQLRLHDVVLLVARTHSICRCAQFHITLTASGSTIS